jgi:hypothetical protein
MARARTVAEVISGEAVSGSLEDRWNDMLNIASVISNRAQQLGVSMQDVVGTTREFNAYNRPLPAGVGEDIIGLAQEAIDYVEANGPVNSATFYATPAAQHNLPGQLSFETETEGHRFFSDPLGRAIRTAVGVLTPNQYAYAANIEDVPVPAMNPSAIPTQNPAFLAGDQLANVDPNMALAVPDPLSNLPAADLATAQTFEKPAPAQNPWGGAPMSDVAASGFLGAPTSLDAQANVANSGVLPGPKSDNFSQVAAAGPMGGDYAAPEDRFAAAVPGGFLNAPTNRAISQEDVQRALFNATGAQMDPAFTEALMSPTNPVVPTAVETQSFAPEQSVDIASSRFSTPAKTSRIGQEPAFADARMPGLIDPATNTQSFMDQPADIGGFLSAAAAQRDVEPNINSAEMGARLADVQRQLLNPEMQAQPPAAVTAENVPAQTTGFLNNPAMQTPNFAQAMNPSVPAMATTPVGMSEYEIAEAAKSMQVPGVAAAAVMSSPATAYKEEAPALPAVSAIEAQRNPAADVPATGSLATPEQQMAGYQQAAKTMAKAGMLNIGQQPPTDLSGNLPVGFDVLGTTAQAPALDEVEVADQPAISDTQVNIPGPATTSVDQQQAQTTSKSPTTAARTTQPASRAKPSFTDTVKGFLNPGTSIGATLGGFLGLPGAVTGGFLGNAAYQALQSPSQPMSINNIGGGTEAVYSVWGGGAAPGTQATASDGQTVTSMPGGMVAITNSAGVTTTFDKTGKASSYFGSGLSQDQEASTTNGGGLFGGLFG